ncbi:MAG: hypothetical protein AAFV88_19220 [Planctomycetota bacterium]
MADSKNDPAEFNRRASDQTGGGAAGDRVGGRRKSDKHAGLPRNKYAKFAIAGSFLFSLSLIAWAFTLPFRGGSGVKRGSGQQTVDGKLVALEYEARLDAEEYVNYTRQIDQRLMEQLRRKNELDRQAPSDDESNEVWEKTVAKKKQELEQLVESAGEEGIVDGTIESEQQRYLEEVLLDAPK